ncbi:MAG: type II secretion system F family protein [Lachnospiraceae bacterium]
METYSYKAVAADGKEKKGSIDADSREAAIKKLKDNGLVPINVKVQSVLDKDIKLSVFKKKITPREMSVFCRQFASILKAGVSVISALEMLGEQTENKELKASVKKLQSGVEKGSTLSEAMKLEKSVYPELLINMVAAGEASGSLEAAIERMAVQFEKEARLKALVKKAMMYPIVLFVVAIGVMLLMLVYVIPQFNYMFEEIGSELPAYTKVILAVSDFIRKYWYIIIGVIAAVIAAYKYYKKTDRGRRRIDEIKMKLPVFGVLATKTACARFSRTMATLLQSGMSMMDALDIVGETMDNVLFKEGLKKSKNGVALGFNLSAQLAMSGLFPPMVIHMTNIGESTGNLEKMLTNVADYYDEEVEAATQQITALMEPIIIVVMAVIVAILVLSIYGPISQLYSDLG